MEKYGFVYLWYDKKHKRFYIGCRWGNENDGYICSSPWMKQGYKLRPNDFKRRILSRVYTNKYDLLEEEYRWISKIKSEELGEKYYNLHNHHFGHWSANPDSKLSIGQKVSQALTGKKHTEDRIEKKRGRKLSEETRRKIAIGNTGKRYSDETKRKMSATKKGRPMSDDEKRKRSETMKRKWQMIRGEKND